LHNTNHLNSLLIIVSAITAWNLPFELFLFSYAVLGPLHYFTEISWLHDRNYYCNIKTQSSLLYIIAILNFISVIVFNEASNFLLLMAFCLALLSTISRSKRYSLLTCLILIPIGYWLIHFEAISLIFITLLPTVIHVFVFTFLFMFYGSLKDKSFSGYTSVVIYLLSIISILIIPESNTFKMSQDSLEYIKPFTTLANQITTSLNRNIENDSIIATFRFLAFIYTFHYLNWFIKIKTIGWHKISKLRILLIILAWMASISIYFYDFKTGIVLLFFFSVLHVLLEFPLNFITVREIGRELFFLRKDK